MSDHGRAQRGFLSSMGSALAGLSFKSHGLKHEVCLRNTRAALRWKSALGPGLQGPAEPNAQLCLQLCHTEQLRADEISMAIPSAPALREPLCPRSLTVLNCSFYIVP